MHTPFPRLARRLSRTLLCGILVLCVSPLHSHAAVPEGTETDAVVQQGPTPLAVPASRLGLSRIVADLEALARDLGRTSAKIGKYVRYHGRAGQEGQARLYREMETLLTDGSRAAQGLADSLLAFAESKRIEAENIRFLRDKALAVSRDVADLHLELGFLPPASEEGGVADSLSLEETRMYELKLKNAAQLLARLLDQTKGVARRLEGALTAIK